MKLIAALMLTGVAFAQPEFDVAVVTVNKSGEPFAERRVLPGRRLELTNNTMRELVIEAWMKRKDEVAGGPAWFNSDRFDVIAKAPAATPDADLHAMLRSLLKDRFGLAVHEEQRSLPVYFLVTLKGGPKLSPPTVSARTFCGGGPRKPGQFHRSCTNMTMEALTQWLPKMSPADFEQPVLNKTGLPGAWDFQLDFSPPARVMFDGETVDPSGPTIFEALREVGLHLELRKLPSKVIVVDHVERTPAAN
jgi:uncharacterized protein (TIGR03435 family)